MCRYKALSCSLRARLRRATVYQYDPVCMNCDAYYSNSMYMRYAMRTRACARAGAAPAAGLSVHGGALVHGTRSSQASPSVRNEHWQAVTQSWPQSS